MNETMTIDGTGELMIYAESATGWGKGKTLPEALRNMKQYSRGWVEESYTRKVRVEGKKRPLKRDVADLLWEQDVSIWMTDDPSPVFGLHGGVTIHEGYHYIQLGDQYNVAKLEHGTAKADAQ